MSDANLDFLRRQVRLAEKANNQLYSTLIIDVKMTIQTLGHNRGSPSKLSYLRSNPPGIFTGVSYSITDVRKVWNNDFQRLYRKEITLEMLWDAAIKVAIDLDLSVAWYKNSGNEYCVILTWPPNPPRATVTMMMSAPATTALGRFTQRDGDHAIMMRVLFHMI